MAFMSRSINIAEPTAAFRTLVFGVVNTNGTAKTDLGSAPALLSVNGAAAGATSASHTHLSNGRYQVVLTVSEVTQTAGAHLMVGQNDGAGYHVIWAEAQITPTAADNALALRNAILNWPIFAGVTFAKALRDMATVLLGLLTGGGTNTEVYTNSDAATVTVTTDDGPDRTAVVSTNSGTP